MKPATQLLQRLQSKVLPDVFLHPIWSNYIENNNDIPQRLILDLIDSAHQYENNGEIVCCCQILLMCARLYSASSYYEAAMQSIGRAWNLANTYHLFEIARFSAWGASSISFIQSDIPHSIRYLDALEHYLIEDNDWVSANIVDLIKKSLDEKDREPAFLNEFREFLKLWGNVNPIIEARNNSNSAGNNPDPDSSLLEKIIGPGYNNLSGIWSKLKSLLFRFNLIRLDNSPDTAKRYNYNTISIFSKRSTLQIDKFSNPHNRIRAENWVTQPDHKLPTTARMATLSEHSVQSIHRDRITVDGISPSQKYSMTVYCLGPFRIYQNDQFVENWTSRKGLSVFKYLVLEHPKPVAKDILMDLFWPEADPEAARRNLHQAIYSTRQTLKTNHPAIQLIIFENDSYFFNPDVNIWIDYRAFEHHVRTGHRFRQAGEMDRAILEYSIAENIYQGDFMTDDLYETWLLSRRQHLWQTYIFIAHQLAQHNLGIGNYLATSVLCRRILEMDNCQEEAHRNLMKCYIAQDQPQLAISQYHICVQNLKSELELPPSAETKALLQQVLSTQ